MLSNIICFSHLPLMHSDNATWTMVFGRMFAARGVGGADYPQITEDFGIRGARFRYVGVTTSLTYELASTTSDLTIGFHCRRGDHLTAWGNPWLSVLNGLGQSIFQVGLEPGTTKFRIGPTISTPTVVTEQTMPTTQWMFFEIALHLDGSEGTLDVWMDGEHVVSLTDVATVANAGPAAAVMFRSAGTSALDGASAYAQIADGYILVDESGPSAAKGPGLWIDKVPNSDQSPQEWARVPANGDNYTAINEAEANGETDYIESTGDGARARFGLTNPSLAHDPIFVVPYAVARKTEAGTDDLILRLHKGGQQDDGDPIQVDFPSFQSIGRWAPLDPSTGNPWTREGIEGVDLELEHEGGS